MVHPDNQASLPPKCPRCFRPMLLSGTLPKTTNLPGVYSYRCDPCRENAVFDDRQAEA
jgi:hypothetical protein